MKKLEEKRALVVFSGGQDSTTCLGWAIKKYGKENVVALCFDYGQRHKIELEVAECIAERLGVQFEVFSTDILKTIGDSALVKESTNISETKDGLPASFVPGRNIFFLTVSSQMAYKLNCKNIITGVCETDFSGYPDCRDNFIKSLQVTLSLGLEADVIIHTPLMWINKKQTWELAEEVGCLSEIFISHTCYEGDRSIKNEWGYGCGDCPSCKLRKKGYEEFKS